MEGVERRRWEGALERRRAMGGKGGREIERGMNLGFIIRGFVVL